MSKFFLCKEPTVPGGHTFWGIKLSNISEFSFEADKVSLMIYYGGGFKERLQGLDALRLLKAMGVKTSVPLESLLPLAQAGDKAYDQLRVDEANRQLEVQGCPLGTVFESDKEACKDSSQCPQFNDCVDHAVAIDEGLVDLGDEEDDLDDIL